MRLNNSRTAICRIGDRTAATGTDWLFLFGGKIIIPLNAPAPLARHLFPDLLGESVERLFEHAEDDDCEVFGVHAAILTKPCE